MTISVVYVCDRCGRKEIVGGWPDSPFVISGWDVSASGPILCPACAGEGK